MRKISIVVPSYNQGHLIAFTIDSILSQGVPDLEVLVVDGGSKDETVEVLKSYGDRIDWVSERDNGQTHAINKGLRKAKGEVVAYINSDDTYEPGVISRALKLLDASPEIDFIYGDANFVDESGALLRRTRAVDFDIGILTYDHDYICQPASFWRRSVMERIGYFDESLYYYMDYEYFLRLAHAGAEFRHVREPWANLRLHSACKTVTGNNDNRKQYLEERTATLDRYRKRFGSDRQTRAVHFALKWLYRAKKLSKDIVENGQLPPFGNRQLMQQMSGSKK